MREKKISEQQILKDYNKLKKVIKKNIHFGFNELACEYIRRASNLMYQSNLMYTDSELEAAIDSIKKRVLPENIKYKDSITEKIAFYDYFAWDNRGLTEQYLDAFVELGYQVIYIDCQRDTNNSRRIIEKIKKTSKINLYIVKEKGYIKQIREICKIIEDFRPTHFLAHTAPWDVTGMVVSKALEGQCGRYLINLTDHAFWLGTKCFDYFFEFRNYGYNISLLHRKIKEDKLFMLPYYPIINKNIDFKGFDFESEGKKIVFSGGSIYKIQGNKIFLELVSWILDSFPETIFLYLGDGDTEYINKFIKDHKYEKRFFLRSEREDIYEVFRHIDIFLNTYPISGALMVQYAAICGKIPFTLTDDGVHTDSDVNELFFVKPQIQIRFEDVEEMKSAISKYLRDEKSLIDAGNKLRDCVVSKNDFAVLLDRYLKEHVNLVETDKYDINVKKFSEIYVQRLNDDKICYYRCFLSKKNMLMNLMFIKYFWHYVKSKLTL